MVVTRVGWYEPSLVNINGKWNLNWDRKGVKKVLHSSDDFIFRSRSVKDAVKRIGAILDLNKNLIITDIKIESK